MKKGVSLVSLIVVIVVMTIITGVVVIKISDTEELVSFSTFAVEIYDIQNGVDEYYYRHSNYPVKSYYEFDVSTIDYKSISQFDKEEITNNKITFKLVDLGAIGVNNTEYGRGTGLDKYVLSESTGKVYYLNGVEYEDVLYYTLTQEAYDIIGIANNNEFISKDDVRIADVIFTPSTLEYTNVPVIVEVKFPSDAVINNITVGGEKSVSAETIQGLYKIVTVNETSTDKTGNYTIEVNYTYNNVAKTAKYEVTNFDNTVPTLSVTETVSDNITIINVTANDVESGVELVKYVENEIDDVAYFENYGKVLNDTEFRLNANAKYTLYVRDKAGNYKILKTEEYAIYSAIDSSLTFVRTGEVINKGSTYNGKTITEVYTGFEDATYTEQSQVPWYSYRASIKSVAVEEEIQPISTTYWFYECSNCSNLDLTKLNTSKVTSMKYMFAYTGNATTVTSFCITGINEWDTSQVTDMGYLFREAGKNATSWSIGDLSKWNTSKVTLMNRMFGLAGNKASKFDIGNLDNWDTGKVTTMRNMFVEAGNSAKEWNIGKLDNWNTSKVVAMAAMFSQAGSNATKWDIGNLDNWDTSSLQEVAYMFYFAGQNASKWNIGKLNRWNMAKVTSMESMFQYAGGKAEEFDIGNLDNWNTSKCTTMIAMFAQSGINATKWNIGDISNWNTSNVTDMYAMFVTAGVKAAYFLDLSRWNVGKVTSYARFNEGVESKVIPPNFK